MRKIIPLVLLSFLMIIGLSAQRPEIILDSVATGYNNITDLTNAGDERLFVVEQAGVIRILNPDGTFSSNPFLDITQNVTTQGNEQGLLGLTFHPDYVTNGYFYVNYTSLPDGTTHISRFSVDPNDPDIANPNSELVLFTQTQPFRNHNAGDLEFGPDGYLYFGLGDGGAANDQLEVAQDGSSFLGKMIRIDVDNGSPYSIPQDNPFINDTSVLDEIWALGLRNPWRFCFDPMNGDMWIADVGQNEFEEINREPGDSEGGYNWGWDCYEAFSEFEVQDCESQDAYDFPVFAYAHNNTHCSVTGGFIYRGSEFNDLNGHYLLTDICSRNWWTVFENEQGEWDTTDQGVLTDRPVTTFGLDQNGEIYAAERSGYILHVTTKGANNTINSDPKGSGINIYPNPVNEYTLINIDIPSIEEGTLTLLDSNGRYLMQKDVKMLSNTSQWKLSDLISVEQLSGGIYYLQLNSKSGTHVSKLLKL